MDLNLQNKVALVTGGSRGLGRAICLCLADEGAHVAVNYNSQSTRADTVVQQIGQQYKRPAVAVGGDVSSESDVQRMFDETEAALGPVDILINNAGIWPTAFVKDMTRAQWDSSLAINLTGPFLTCREAVRRWLATSRKGRIVNVTSQAAFHGATSGHADYAAAKSGLVMFTVSLAREVARHGIYVNAVAPGLMETDMTQAAVESGLDRYMARIPLGRTGTPEEIAQSVVFLTSDRASYTTGATFDASGGMLMR